MNTETAIQEISAEVEAVKINAYSISIVDDATNKKASDLLRSIKLRIKDIEVKRKELVQPINDSVAMINNMFKPHKELAEQIKGIIEEKILEYTREQLRIKEEEARKEKEKQVELLRSKAAFEKELADDVGDAQSDANAKKHEWLAKVIEAEPQSVIKADTVRGEYSTASIRKTWDFEIEKEEEVPREFLCIDEKKVKEAIKKGVREISGLSIYVKESIMSR